MRHISLAPGQVLASDDTILMETAELASGKSTPIIRHPSSDAVYLFHRGQGEIRVADRIHNFDAACHAHISAMTAYQITSTGREPLQFVRALCPDRETRQGVEHDPKASPGGVTMLGIDLFDRFPDSGLIRGGMFFLDPGEVSRYHSHDAAAEIFVFLQSECDAKVEGETERYRPCEALYVAAEMKHSLANVGDTRLVVWLTVTPNVTPSHTFYDERPDGTWNRVTPRLDGRPVAPSTR